MLFRSPLDFVRTAALVHVQKPDVHFAWIGDGPLEEAARALSAELGLENVLHFAGYRTDISQILQATDCFVLSSLWEGFPIVLLEAMAAGAAVVATDIPGNSDAIQPGRNGLLVPAKNPIAMAAAVLNILNNSEQVETFIKNGRQRIIEEFTKQGMLDNLASLYKQIVLEQKLSEYRQPLPKETL